MDVSICSANCRDAPIHSITGTQVAPTKNYLEDKLICETFTPSGKMNVFIYFPVNSIVSIYGTFIYATLYMYTVPPSISYILMG